MSNPVGRPTSYNAEITEKIIDLVIDGQPIRFICSQVDMPSVATVMRWLHDYPEFAKQYALAKEMYAHCIFDEIQHIADTCDPNEVQKAKLMIDARKYIASRLAPRKYGEASLIDAPTEEEQKDREIIITRRIGAAQLSDLLAELGNAEMQPCVLIIHQVVNQVRPGRMKHTGNDHKNIKRNVLSCFELRIT